MQSSSTKLSFDTHPPIVFVHGDSDTAGHWMAQMWRFETNGYPRDRLFALDLTHPGAQADVDIPEDNRSSPADAARALAQVVDDALTLTGAPRVVLVANSRGCQTSRNYVRNYGGAANVAGMVLTGGVYNGVFVSADAAPGSEYNGAGRFLSELNAHPLVDDGQFVTVIRSDRFDLYSQPDGRFIGNPSVATGVDHHSPDLPGADNLVLGGADHRETGYSADAFALIHRAITGHPPAAIKIAPEPVATLSGKLTGFRNEAPTNQGLSGAELVIYPTDPASGKRAGGVAHRQSIGSDGHWGPFASDPAQTYEFEVRAPGLPVYHIFRSPFMRSSTVANLRLYPPVAGEGHAVNVMRPRGYFGPGDEMDANGAPFPGVDMEEPVPHVWQVRLTAEPGARTVVTFNGERIAAVAPPYGHVAWIELTY